MKKVKNNQVLFILYHRFAEESKLVNFKVDSVKEYLMQD